MKFVIIGNGKMVVDCLKLILDNNAGKVCLVVYDSKCETSFSSVSNLCNEMGITCKDSEDVNDEKLVSEIGKAKPDIIFNINSFQIIKDKLLGTPRIGIINFHNGPLPKYGGVNVCSWAILNGESEYGVSWIFINKKIDQGEIIVESKFKLLKDESAVTLIIKCIETGIQLFTDLLLKITSVDILTKLQDLSESSYYSKKDLPYKGWFPLCENFDFIEKLQRALSFYPIKNNFYNPKIIINKETFYVKDFNIYKKEKPKHTVGDILKVEEKSLLVQTAECVVDFSELENLHGKLIHLSRFKTGQKVFVNLNLKK